MAEIPPVRIPKRHGRLHLSGAHETFRGALALVTRRKLLHQIRGSIQIDQASVS